MKLTIRRRVVGLLVFLLTTTGTYAEIGEDTHIQATGQMRIEVNRQVFEEFARMFDLGYPPATVMMHAVSAGMSINDILYIAVKSNVGRAGEFYDTAESLLTALPGWVCQANGTDGERYIRSVNLEELGDEPGIREVAQLFFDGNRRVVPFPKWSEGRSHMEVPVTELAELVTDEQWYIAGQDDGSPRTSPNRPVFVSLYRHNSEIIVDSGLDRIRRAQEQGIERLPVVLVYNDSRHRSISDFEDGITVGELAEEFYGEGIQLTAVPEWQVGDHHKSATVDELLDLVDVPNREDVSKERWQAIEESIRANGMELPQPLLVTLVRSGQGNAWVDDPAVVAVASELEVQSLPVVFFYHEIDRRPCGQPSDCEDLLCEAAAAAGASREVCSSDDRDRATAGRVSEDDEGIRPPGLAGTDVPASGIDPRLYEGLSYTQSQCTS